MDYLSEHVILVLGGVDKENVSVEQAFYIWDPMLNTVYSIKDEIEIPRYAHNTFFYKQKLYVFGGRTD